MTDKGSLDRSIGRAQRHYGSLFSLPSIWKSVLIIAGLCSVVGISVYALFFQLADLTIIMSLTFGLFIFTLLFDWVLSRMVGDDPIFILRRIFAVSLVGWVIWIIFLILAVVLGLWFGINLWIKLCFLGFASVITLRTIVFLTVSSFRIITKLFAIFIQPLLCMLLFCGFWISVYMGSFLPLLLIVVSGSLVSYFSAYVFVYSIDKLGKDAFGIPSMELFRAFMLNWVASLNNPLERFLEKMGKTESIKVSLLKFESSDTKGAFIIPQVHPGPFKNVGSSLLPSLLKQDLEKKYGGNFCVPLGILGHELDVASQAQNQKIINSVILETGSKSTILKASKFVRANKGFVSATCQIFGKTALVSFTLSPKTTEDLPQELNSLVQNEAESYGLDNAFSINSHNCLTSNLKIEATLDELKDVASICLKKAVSEKLTSFSVGTATLRPREFDLKDGMGSGGITAIVVEVVDQRIAYVVIDGNNMVPGLREKILFLIKSIGFDEGEVFTTDSHAVSGLSVGKRGYHPIGEKMDEKLLLDHIQNAVLSASGRLEKCSANASTIVIPEVRVIGEDLLDSVSNLVDKSIQRAKRILLPTFAAEGAVLIALLLFL